MKQKLFTITTLLLWTLNVWGQKGIEAINGFKYAFVSYLVYENKQVDIYGITAYLRSELSKKGLIVLDGLTKNWPKEAKLNPCLVGIWFPSHSDGNIANSAKGGFIVRNCKDEIVYENFSFASHFGYYYEKNSQLAIEKAFKPLRSFTYRFNESLTPTVQYPTVETTTETEESLKKYFDNNKLNSIEGIYKSYQSDQVSFYKLGIIKSGDKFKVIIIESDLPQWKTGEVKAYFEPSSMKDFFSAKWFMANKTPIETFASIENDAILSIEFGNQENNQKRQDKFIKMYPTSSGEFSTKSDKSKASGSGFFISTTGIVATNAHVIEDASKIELTIANEIGTFTYKAKVLLTDNKNDVALIQIDDTTFKGLSALPYSLTEKTDVGEKVFTIGYPLNNIMGTNYKVTDGIISSKSGIADDVRYYQISVPVQPGNSGGPLFNKDGNIIGITSAKLNSKAVGTSIENVNYAVKISYLLNLYNMLPNSNQSQNSSQLAGKELQEQIKTLKNYVCLIKIY